MRIISNIFLAILFGGSLVMALTVPLTASDLSKGAKAKVEHVVEDKYAKMAELEALAEAAAKKKLAEMDGQTAKADRAEMAKPAAMEGPAAKVDRAEMAKPAAMDEPAVKTDRVEMAKPAAMDEPAAKAEPAVRIIPMAKRESLVKDDHAEMAKPAAMEGPAAKGDHAEMAKPEAMDEHAEMAKPAAMDEPAAKAEPAEMAKPEAMKEPAAKDERAVRIIPMAKRESAVEEDHAEMAKPEAMEEQAAKEDHAEMAKPETMEEQAAKEGHAEMAKPETMEEQAAKEDHAEMAKPETMEEQAAKEDHAEMAKPEAMEEQAAKEDHAEMAKPEAMEEQAAKEERAEMAKPEAMEEQVAKEDHAEMDEHAAKDGHATKVKLTAEEEFRVMEALIRMSKKAAKNEHGETDEPAATDDEHGETSEEDELGEASEHEEESEHAEAGEHGEEATLEQYETSFEPLPEGPNQPWRLIRQLQMLQDKIVVGKPGALANYRDALVDISHKLLEDDHVGTWSNERNLTAAATYLLIGGDPNVGTHAFELSNLSLTQKLPLAAAIAYVGRKYTRAGWLLSAIDINRLPGSAKGQFALVQAMATSSAVPLVAITYLEQARRFAPGTLTEEAALRRLIRLAAEHADKPEGVDVFLNHANAYFRHFRNSVYATDFLRNYGFGIVRTPDGDAERALEHLKSVFTDLNKEQQVFLIAIVARNAVVLGRLEMGRWASDWLLEHVSPGDKLHARIELYQIATSILDAESYADAAERLGKLPVKFLGKSDLSLHGALVQLSSRIGSDLIDVERLKELTRIEKQSFPGDEPKLPFDVEKEMELAKANPVLMRTAELLAKADRLLER